MAYPSTKVTFSSTTGTSLLSSPDHSALHNSVSTTLEAIQDTAGTTLGTNIFRDFAAGNFPARVTGVAATGTFVQTLVGGTLSANIVSNMQGTLGFLNKGTLGSVASVGGTLTSPLINTATVGTSNIIGGTLGSAFIGTPTFSQNAIVGSALGTNAGLLGHTPLTIGTQGTITTETMLVGGTLVVTVPAGGRAAEVSVYLPDITNGGVNQTTTIRIKEGAGTLQSFYLRHTEAASESGYVSWIGTPSAASHTYTVTAAATGGSCVIVNQVGAVGYILAKLL